MLLSTGPVVGRLKPEASFLSFFIVLLVFVGIPAWSGSTGMPMPRLLATLPHDRGNDLAAFSPDGKTLATNSGETLVLWEVATRQVRATLKPHWRRLGCVAFAPDGKSLATTGSAAADGQPIIKLWDPATGKGGVELRGHTRGILRLVFSPDGKILASSASDYTIRLWNPATGEGQATLAVNKEFFVYALAFSPDSRTLAMGGGKASNPAFGEVALWDVARREIRSRFRRDPVPVKCLAFSPDGKTLASAPSGSFQRAVKLWDPATGQVQATWPIPMDSVSLAFSPDGKILVVGGAQPDPTNFDASLGESRFLDAATGKEIGALKARIGRNGRDHVAFSPDGKLLAIAASS